MSKKRRRKPVPASLADDLMLAPMVMFMRLPLMAADAGKSTLVGTETALAVSEKSLAAAEGIFAAQMSFIKSAAQFWPEVMAGKSPSMLNGVAAQRSLDAALKPAGKRVRANFRRLSARV